MIKDCVFCKIVQGQIPCDKVYEDDLVLAFLDIATITLGHTLIVPKQHHTSITTLPTDCGARIMDIAPRLGSALMRATGAAGFNLLLANGTAAGQVVPHTHLHVLPRHVDDGVVMPTSHTTYPSPECKAEILEKARARLQ
jgi:histidine triad (HIT) family protein